MHGCNTQLQSHDVWYRKPPGCVTPVERSHQKTHTLPADPAGLLAAAGRHTYLEQKLRDGQAGAGGGLLMGFSQQPGLPPRLSERAQNMFVSSDHFVDLGARALIAKVGLGMFWCWCCNCCDCYRCCWPMLCWMQVLHNGVGREALRMHHDAVQDTQPAPLSLQRADDQPHCTCVVHPGSLSCCCRCRLPWSR